MKTNDQNRLEKMISHIAKENNLKNFLEKHEIANVADICDIQIYQPDEHRRGLIVEYLENNTDATSKILIDLKQGLPIINQVYDAVYGIGKDCTKRIIIYTNGSNEYDKEIPAADYWIVYCLTNNLRQYPLGIHFYEMNEKILNIGPHYMGDPYEISEIYPLNKIPSEEQFIAEVFWQVYFDSFSGCFYEPHKTFNTDIFRGLKNWGHLIYIDCSFSGEIKLYWDQTGVRFVVKQVTESHEYLKMVLDYEMQSLQKRYGVDSVEFENVVGKLPRLYIQYSDRPFDWLYTATPEQITEFAEKMHEDAWSLRWQIEERIDGLMEKIS